LHAVSLSPAVEDTVDINKGMLTSKNSYAQRWLGYTRALIKLMLRGRLKGMIKDQQGQNKNKYICQKTISNAIT